MKRKNRIIPLLVLVLIMSMSWQVFAHRMTVEVIDEGSVRILYDDGTAAGNALVRLYDSSNQLLLEGNADQEGFFYFQLEGSPHRIVSEDGLGHRARWVEGQGEGIDRIPLWIRVILGLGLLFFVAAIAQRRSRLKKHSVK